MFLVALEFPAVRIFCSQAVSEYLREDCITRAAPWGYCILSREVVASDLGTRYMEETTVDAYREVGQKIVAQGGAHPIDRLGGDGGDRVLSTYLYQTRYARRRCDHRFDIAIYMYFYQ
ncbi:hypothetical protein SCLCIDRAFT_1212866 [Scleroderma citrinum Foug A]|uniref:Uncharacterized protein n=1 Tax=Scleroderma citrinum Foug A TaxID=1036808 RepID=A0A0C3E8S1_9AGAM|nr:hypothetical protein SCLCIDRAFT_1212866 [Scleroderma citrinum Foug A]